jgi:hypothetical protein
VLTLAHWIRGSAVAVDAFLLTVLAALTALCVSVVGFLRKIKELVKELDPAVSALTSYRNLRKERYHFCDYFILQLRQLNSLERWHHSRYTDLHASLSDVETRGHRRFWRLGSATAVRRERSLSRALKRSSEPLIVLEGEPGSGKSIALRTLALTRLERAQKSKRVWPVVPLYINLKGLPNKLGAFGHQDVRRFVLQKLTEGCSHEERAFLDRHFEAGLNSGRWLFLFDSFDEAPAILGAINYDEAVDKYSGAIAEFLTRPNMHCRGVLASRYFRGPDQTLWTRFTILAMTSKQQDDFLRKHAVPRRQRKSLLAELALKHSPVSALANNPLFLGLLTEYISDGSPVPDSAHRLFERHVRHQVEQGSDYLSEHGMQADDLWQAAEIVAFVMLADGLGLSPDLTEISGAVKARSLLEAGRVETSIAALEFVKLMRRDPQNTMTARPTTFVHRRFQEYFATRYLFKNPAAVSPRQLLTDGRWRESAVTVLQVPSDGQSLAGLVLEEAEEFLRGASAHSEDVQSDSLKAFGAQAALQPFEWPTFSVHVLGILSEGLGRPDSEVPPAISTHADRVLKAACANGSRADQKAAVSMVSAASRNVGFLIIRGAFGTGSPWLRDVAFAAVSMLRRVPNDLAKEVRVSLLRLAATGRLRREKREIGALLRRLTPSSHWSRLLRLLVMAPAVNLLIFGALGGAGWLEQRRHSDAPWGIVFVSIMVMLSVLIYPFIVSFVAYDSSLPSITETGSWWRRSVGLAALCCALSPAAWFIMVPILSVPESRAGWTVSLGLNLGLAALCVLFAASWLPAALLACRRGRVLHPLMWPVLPLVIALDLLAELPKIAKLVFRGIQRFGLLRTTGCAFLFVAAAIMYLGTVGLLAALAKEHGEVGRLGFTITAVVVVTAVALAPGPIRDWNWERRWSAGFYDMKEPATVENLQRWLPELRTRRYLLRMLYKLRTAPHIALDPSAANLIKSLLYTAASIQDGSRLVGPIGDWLADKDSRVRSILRVRLVARARIPSNSPQETKEWLTAHWQGKIARLRLFTGACGDELGKLIDAYDASNRRQADEAALQRLTTGLSFANADTSFGVEKRPSTVGIPSQP